MKNTLTWFIVFFTLYISLSINANETQPCHDCDGGGGGGGGNIQPKGEICEGWYFKIEPDMQITDSDLTEESFKRSLQWLDENIDKHGHLYTFGKLNSLKEIEGYLLKTRFLNAESEVKETAKESYCEWLSKEGYWFD